MGPVHLNHTGASQVEKSPRLNWATQFLTVAYDGACSPNVSARMAWIYFGALPWRKGNLMTIAPPCCWNRARRLTCFLSACKNKRLAVRHEQTPISNDTIDYFLRHREVGRAKDLSALPRTYPPKPAYIFLQKICAGNCEQIENILYLLWCLLNLYQTNILELYTVQWPKKRLLWLC